MEVFLFQASIYLAAAVLAVPLAIQLGLGSVLGYLLAGIFIGPVFGIVGAEAESLQHFAEFGVVLMLFLIGLELDPRGIWDMRMRLMGLGGLQILGTMALVTAGSMALGQPLTVAVAIAMCLALSSTAIVLQTLTEKGLMQTRGGRSAFSVLLMQDIAVIPMLALLPLLTLSEISNRVADDHGAEGAEAGMAAAGPVQGAEAAMSFIEGLPGWGVTMVTLAAVGVVILFGTFATRPLFKFVHGARLREMYTAFALLIVVGIAAMMLIVGLSPALGSFMAGVVLANSEFRHELESDIEPFKGLLLGLFFITVGAGIDFNTLAERPVAIIGATLLLMFLKGVVLFGLALGAKMGRRDRWLFTLGLAQAGEFGFVLISFSVQQNVIPAPLSQSLLLVIALSMLLTPLFFILFEKLASRIEDASEDREADEIDEEGEIIIAGIGRFGQVINRMVQSAGFRTVVIDNDLTTIQLMRRFGFKGFFGDPTRPELLHAAGLARARVMVVGLNDPEAAVRLTQYVRRERPDIHIVARARDRVNVYELYRAGANDIVRELFDSSLRAGRYVLENMGIAEYEAHEIERAFFKLDRHAIRELAPLWNPDLPVADNHDYVERAKELNKELETAIVNEIGQKDEQDAA